MTIQDYENGDSPSDLLGEFGLQPSDVFSDFAGRAHGRHSAFMGAEWYQDYKRAVERLLTATRNRDSREFKSVFAVLDWTKAQEIARRYKMAGEREINSIEEYYEGLRRAARRAKLRAANQQLQRYVPGLISELWGISERDLQSEVRDALRAVKERFGAKAEKTVKQKVRELLLPAAVAGARMKRRDFSDLSITELAKLAVSGLALAHKEFQQSGSEEAAEEYSVVSDIFREVSEKLRALRRAVEAKHAPASRGDEAGEVLGD